MTAEITALKGVFVFAATIIGAGILALPVAAAAVGLFPTILILMIIGVMSSFSALYIAEAVLLTEGVYHLPTLAEKYLGRTGLLAMLLGVIVYIYGALTGYLSAGGQLVSTLSGGSLPVWSGVLVYFLVASIVVHLGLKLMSQVETWIFAGMLMLLGLVMAIAMRKIKVPLLLEANWLSMTGIFGIVLFAFVGHSVIPSIAAGLDSKRDINKVAVWGVMIPLVLYIIWCIVVIGVVPKENLFTAKENGQPATIPLGIIAGGSIAFLGNVFAVLSTMTSYIGFGFSLKEIYRDTARSFNKHLKSALATGLVVIPPLIITLLRPGAFIKALEIGGTYGGGIFVGVLPVLIVLKARRINGKPAPKTWGGQLIPWLILGIYLAGMVHVTWKTLF